MSNNIERLSEILDGQRWQGIVICHARDGGYNCIVDLCRLPFAENPKGHGGTIAEAIGKAVEETLRQMKPKPKPVLPGLELPKPKLTLPGF